VRRPESVKLCEVPGVVPVALELSELTPVPKRTTPVAVRSVLNVITALVVPDNDALTFEVSDTRFTSIDVDPVLPEASVATTVIVLLHPVRPETTFDQVHVPRVAADPFTMTLLIDPESDTVPVSVGEAVSVAPLECDVIVTNGEVVSAMLTLNESVLDITLGFQAISSSTPVHIETSTVPVDTVGVIVNVYPVELV
jgi:hypothetical protein